LRIPVGARFEQALKIALASSGESGSAGNFFPLLIATIDVDTQSCYATVKK
jgi:hypothetical protein